MELFDYLMAKKGHNTSARGDLFSYLLGKKASGGSGTYTTFSGTSLNISNTIKAKIKNFMLNSTELTQDGTPTPDNPVDVNVITGSNNIKIESKNLLNFTFTDTVTRNGITFTKNNDGSLTLNGTATTTFSQVFNITHQVLNGTYTIKHNVLGGTTSENSYMSIQKSPSGNISDRVYGGTGSSTFDITEDTIIITASLYITSGTTFTDYNVGSQLEIGSTATEYIEHQEQNYPITLSSKNLFNINGDVNTRYNGQTGNYNTIDGNNLTTTYSTNDGYPYGQRIYVGTGKKVTISGVVSNINSTGSKSALIMCFNDNTTTGVQSVGFADTEINTRKSLTFTADTDYIIVAFAGRYTGFVSATFTDIQVEYGETATFYMPYIANPIEYCKIRDYADQIFKNTTDSPYYDNTLVDGDWYLKKSINKYIFNGSENWQQYQSNVYVNGILPVGDSNSLVINGYCDKCLTNTNTNIGYNSNAYNGVIIYNLISFWGLEETTPTAWKIYLSNNNLILYYPLKNPTYIHITQEDYPALYPQLENIYNNAKSYNGQTNITQTNEDLPFNISVDVKVANE